MIRTLLRHTPFRSGVLIALVMLTLSSCGHSSASIGYQSAHGVVATIVSAKASSMCAEISTKIENLGTMDVWIVLSGGGPFFDRVTPQRDNSSSGADLRLSFSERVPASLPLHASPPRLLLLPAHESRVMRTRIVLPIKEDPIFSSEYLGYGYPAPDWLRNVVRQEHPPFHVRVNVGVLSRHIDLNYRSRDDLWGVLSAVLSDQYIAETQSVMVSSLPISFDCFPGVSILRE